MTSMVHEIPDAPICVRLHNTSQQPADQVRFCHIPATQHVGSFFESIFKSSYWTTSTGYGIAKLSRYISSQPSVPYLIAKTLGIFEKLSVSSERHAEQLLSLEKQWNGLISCISMDSMEQKVCQESLCSMKE